MKKIFPSQEPFNFLGLEKQDLKKAKVLILPIPYEGTVFHFGGTKEGPAAIISASRCIEIFDLERKREIKHHSLFTLPFLSCSKNSPKEAIKDVEMAVEKIVKLKKFPVMLGGEHTITFGIVSALQKFFRNNFSILQFDAHADLRNEFEGTKYSHATFARRIVEDLKLDICQVGIRAISKEEFEFLEKTKKVKTFFKRDFDKKEILDFLKENVYLTIDLDCLDPSIMPAVGTPEPDGLFLEEMLNLVKEICQKKRVLGLDVVELSPIPGIFFPNQVAAHLLFKILTFLELIF